MEFAVLTQVPGESPGYMELNGIYDCESELRDAVLRLERSKVMFGVYRLWEPEAANEPKVHTCACGFPIHPSETVCGECICEEDGC